MIVGVELLRYFSTRSRTAFGSVRTSRCSKAIPLTSRKAFTHSQGAQPSWQNRITAFCFIAHQTNKLQKRCRIYAISILLVISAVFRSIAETEQYFSLESRTASSAALRETAPLIL